MHRHVLFPLVKTAALYANPFKSYSQNSHPPFFLKWVVIRYSLKLQVEVNDLL